VASAGSVTAREPRISIVSRIFAPEASAASALLRNWAEEFRDRGARVTVVTARPPRGAAIVDPPGIDVRRAPVLRDRQQYVRGYLSYLSFDVPLFFRLLFGRRVDLYVVEPPPTTVAVVRVVAWLRRSRYVVDAADLWSDAAAMVTSSRFVLGALRRVELWGLRGAAHLFTAHESLLERFREVGILTPATPIGFGIDTAEFDFRSARPDQPTTFVYGGTYSEWHGAGVFIEAFASFRRRHPDARLLFLGNGQDRDLLERRVAELGLADAVEFRAPVSPHDLSALLADATASLASLKPGQGYDYAFTTKVYGSLASGCPVLFAGTGPTIEFLTAAAAEHPAAGTAVDYDPAAVSAAMEHLAEQPPTPAQRAAISRWTRERYSLSAMAATVVSESLAILTPLD
jgi:glycosyltransferase involved in cell wall biosynthesis